MSRRDHDNEPVPEIPGMVAERDELRQSPAKPKAREREKAADKGARAHSNAWAYVAGAIALAAAGWAGYLHLQLQAAELRVAALEERLSSTDASVNQSSVALQVKINELDAALAELRDETLKRYKTSLDQRGAQIDTLDKALKSTQGGIAKLDQRLGEHDRALDNARAQIDKIPPTVDAARKRIDEQQAALDTLSSRIKTVSDGQNKLDARLSNNEAWVESINTFRKQMNREIVNIKQQIAGSRPTPAPEPIP